MQVIRRIRVSLLAATVLTMSNIAFAEPVTAPAPPATAKKPHVTKVHGDTLVDNYFWLREKSNPDVIAHLEAENAYTAAMTADTQPLQQKLYAEMLSHVKQTDVNVPYRLGGYYYYSRTEEGKQYPIYARKKGRLDAAEEITLDLNELAKGLKFLSLGSYRVSDDGNLLAYSTDTTGYRQYTLVIKDLRTGALLPEKIERVDTVMWATDNKTIFYVTEDAITKRSDSFYRHVLGTTANDLVFHEPDELYDIGAFRTRDKAFIVVESQSKTTSEARYLPANKPTEALRVVVPRTTDHKYFVDHRGDLFYIRTNDHAKNYRMVTTPDSAPEMKNWKEIIAAREDVKLDDFDLFKDHMAVSELQGGLQTIRVIDLQSNQSSPIAFPEQVYSVFLDTNPEFDSTALRYRYQSLVTPSSVYDFDMASHSSKLLKRVEVPNYDPTNYSTVRVYATAADGTRIPMSMVYKKPLVRDGKRPVLLYAYGSYGSPTWPTFNSARLTLLDRGVMFVIAHIRGGGELGEPWREAGRMMTKRNTFTDFVAVAEHLVNNHYSSRDRLVIQGGSAGGLLMGAVVNMRPDLFKAVVAQVPFVDVINTMLDASLPLTTSEYLEWGNPNIKKEYDYIKTYSPYDNIAAKAYPAMLVKVSLNDSQVPYWEGTKFVAKLREMKTDSNPLLLKVNMGAGHGGSSGRYDALRETAADQAFMLKEMGIRE
ncbi:MAG TPA: S9 family peptidase [Thermoanaerobaculia bacterium]|jgi:oligopeptidase B|nr:S9 family peptidase [Thermoanaerobaculia bacterium]